MVIDYTDKPCLIGIAGGSASGKTTISNNIFNSLTEKSLRGYIISIDDFYISTTDEERNDIENIDFDNPKRIDFSELESVLKNVIDRKNVSVPNYDFKTCKRTHNSIINCKNIDFVIIEGLFCLHNENIRKLLDASIFIDIPDNIRWKRRVERDVIERGANLNDLVEYYNKFVKPGYEKYILPTKKYSDKILSDWSNTTFKKIISWFSSKFLLEA